jgi:hypothetical protein
MKQLNLKLTCATSVTFITAGFASWMVIALSSMTPAEAGEIYFQEINAALSFPNSSQRFFEEGLDQLEEEVQVLQNPPEPVIINISQIIQDNIDEFRQQQEDWIPQQQLNRNTSDSAIQ